MSKTYRVTFFDRNCIRPNCEVLVVADAKYLAKDAARQQLLAKAKGRVEFITNGMAGTIHTVIDHKGNERKARVLDVSPEYYNYLLNECWGIADVMEVVSVNSGVSSESAVARAEKKLHENYAECENEQQGDTSIQRRKRRWTRAEKRAAKAAKLALVA